MGWLPFGAEFCEGNYDDPEKGFRRDCTSAREQGMASATVLRGVMVSVNIASYIRQDSAFVGGRPMVVDIVEVEKRWRGSVAVGRNDHIQIGDVGTITSSSVQGLIARSREGQRTESVRGMCRSAQSGNLAFRLARNSASIFNVEYGCKSQSQVQKALGWRVGSK